VVAAGVALWDGWAAGVAVPVAAARSSGPKWRSRPAGLAISVAVGVSAARVGPGVDVPARPGVGVSLPPGVRLAVPVGVGVFGGCAVPEAVGVGWSVLPTPVG
jgi:hypothetical protein